VVKGGGTAVVQVFVAVGRYGGRIKEPRTGGQIGTVYPPVTTIPRRNQRRSGSGSSIKRAPHAMPEMIPIEDSSKIGRVLSVTTLKCSPLLVSNTAPPGSR
jgi:hypothetical protein